MYDGGSYTSRGVEAAAYENSQADAFAAGRTQPGGVQVCYAHSK